MGETPTPPSWISSPAVSSHIAFWPRARPTVSASSLLDSTTFRSMLTFPPPMLNTPTVMFGYWERMSAYWSLNDWIAWAESLVVDTFLDTVETTNPPPAYFWRSEVRVYPPSGWRAAATASARG